MGPVPFCGMMLADMGADVVRVDRVNADSANLKTGGILERGRRSVAINLKDEGGVDLVLEMASHADVMMEGFRPGVVERLGLSPEQCLERNPRLVYARMTGWGQSGPLADSAGHDINYIALAGVLAHIGRRGGAPVPPLNLVGDFGGGGMLLAVGILSALMERTNSNQGQIIDAAMLDGAALLMAPFTGLLASGDFTLERGTNLVDSGAPFYDVYECSDGEYVSVGALEPEFYALLVERIGLVPSPSNDLRVRDNWEIAKVKFAEIFRMKTRAEWCKILEGTDACFAPVLSLEEAPQHPQNQVRRVFQEFQGVIQPSPAPRFSPTPGSIQGPSPAPGADTREVLREWLGHTHDEIDALLFAGVIGSSEPA